MRLLTVPALAVATLALAGCGGDSGGGSSGESGPSASASASAQEQSDDGSFPEVPGMEIFGAVESVEVTVGKLEEGLGKAGMVVATVDHAANAESVGESLDPTVLVIGGNAEVGTPILEKSATAGLELPLRFLVWEENDTTWVGFNSGEYIAARAGIADVALLDPIVEASEMLAAEAAGTAKPASEKSAEEVEVGNVEQAGTQDVSATADQLVSTLEEAGLMVVADVDHAANALSVGKELDPLRLVVAGNPEAGTPFLLADQTIGIDLPMRFLVEPDGDASLVLVPDLADLVARHGITGMDEAVAGVEEAQQGLLDQATSGGGSQGD